MNWLLSLSLGLLIGIFAGQRIMLARQRLRGLRRTLDHSRGAESLVALFSKTMEARASAEKAGLAKHVKVLNAVQFVAVWNWDLRELLHLGDEIGEVWTLEAGWRRKLLARTLALTIYENLTKIQDFFDPEWKRTWSLRRAVNELGLGDELGDLLDATHERIKISLEPHAELLKGIRTNVIGHKDQDVATQMAWVKETDVEALQRLGYDMLALTNTILEALSILVAKLPRRSGPTTA
jgi:hypothetical protein